MKTRQVKQPYGLKLLPTGLNERVQNRYKFKCTQVRIKQI